MCLLICFDFLTKKNYIKIFVFCPGLRSRAGAEADEASDVA